MKRPTELKTVPEVIAALGGPTFLGERFDIGQNAVSNWKIRGHIPPGWHLRVYLSIRQRGLEVHPSVFGLDTLDGLKEEPSKRRGPSRKERPKAHAA